MQVILSLSNLKQNEAEPSEKDVFVVIQKLRLFCRLGLLNVTTSFSQPNGEALWNGTHFLNIRALDGFRFLRERSKFSRIIYFVYLQLRFAKILPHAAVNFLTTDHPIWHVYRPFILP